MPNNNQGQYILDQVVTANEWTTLPADFSGPLPAGKVLIPLAYWLSRPPELKITGDIGIWLDSDAELEDGRGFSLGRLVRERYGFHGELRAIGNPIRDQIFFLHRCGFNGFDLRDGSDLKEALAAFNEFESPYQSGVDKKEPLFRREAL
ncbi:MAG: DUF934 domain-containing protein [bacterium]